MSDPSPRASHSSLTLAYMTGACNKLVKSHPNAPGVFPKKRRHLECSMRTIIFGREKNPGGELRETYHHIGEG